MKIPNIMLKFKCTVTPLLGITPTGKSFGTAISNIKCYVERNVKWRGNSQISNGQQHERYTKVMFNNRLDIPDEIEIDGKLIIEGDSRIYTIVDAQKFKQFVHEHWEVILR